MNNHVAERIDSIIRFLRLKCFFVNISNKYNKQNIKYIEKKIACISNNVAERTDSVRKFLRLESLL